MTRGALLLATSLLLLLISVRCQGAEESMSEGGDRSETALLRLQNESGMDFSSVTIRFPGEEEDFGAIAAGQATDYRAFENAYRYGSVTVEAGGETYEVRAIDYVGETPLKAGRYTYRLDIADGDLQAQFEED